MRASTVLMPAVRVGNAFGTEPDKATISELSIEVALPVGDWNGFDEYEECIVPPARPTVPAPAWAEEAPTTPGFDIREFNASFLRQASGSEGKW
jgi:hypothetical protein